MKAEAKDRRRPGNHSRPAPNCSLQEKLEHCEAILDHIHEYLYSVAYYKGLVRSIYHSPQCLKLTGYAGDEFCRDHELWLNMIHPEDCEMIREFLRDIWSDRQRLPIEHRIIHKDGSERWVRNNCAAQRDAKGRVMRLDGSMLDITGMKNTVDDNSFLTHYDPLTRLPNRNMLNNRLEKAIVVARREKKELALLFLDLDNFKFVNDSLGHDMGDKLLMAVSQKLNELVRGGDTVARYGGDEFAILFRASNDEMEERLRNAIETAFLGHSLETSAPYSIRVSAGSGKYGNGYAKSIPELINTADAGLYEQKKQKQIVRRSSWLHG